MKNSLEQSINAQRSLLNKMLETELRRHAHGLSGCMEQPDKLDQCLRKVFLALDYCKYVFVLDANAIQISSTINRYGADTESLGRDRSERPYMQHRHEPNKDFNLSEAYISRNKKRPSITAIQTIRQEDGAIRGYLGVDYDLRDLPVSNVIYEESSQWRQIKGDPAIRQGLFLQQRAESPMDQNIDNILSVHEALMLDQGVHHFQIHFSSSRSIIWHVDDPFVYRLLTMDELSDPNICLAYPRRPYFDRAIVPPRAIAPILKQFKALRFADETVYLRSGSLNLVNGKIGLNFSCDGTHYLSYDEFLEQGLDFWFGGSSFPQTVEMRTPVELDYSKLDAEVEKLAAVGCIQVNKLLYAIENGEVPEALTHLAAAERDYVYRELKSVMDVYDGGVCRI